MVGLWVEWVFPMPVGLSSSYYFPVTGLDTFGNVAIVIQILWSICLWAGSLSLLPREMELHKRISLQIPRITGFKGDRVILGFMISTYLISMWISNTATTMMMYPIAMSARSTCLNPGIQWISIAALRLQSSWASHASNIGGLSTIIGTPPNSAFAAYIHEHNGVTLGFCRVVQICLSAICTDADFIVHCICKGIVQNKSQPDVSELPFIKMKSQNWALETRASPGIVCFILPRHFGFWKDVVNKLTRAGH